MLVTTSGGVTDGDSLSMSIAVEPGATALATTQAAEKIYRAAKGGGHCTMEIAVTVGAGAALEPDPPRPGRPDLGRTGLAGLARLHAGGAAVMTRPVIGISCCTRTIGTEHAQAVMNRYVVHALRYADVAGLLVPALPDLMSAREVAPRLDGLLLTGGPDIAAEFHAEPVTDFSLIQDPEPARDAWEFSALREAIERGLPILSICKGVQVLNVALGGTLHLDIRGHDLPELKFQNLQPLRHERSAGHQFAQVNSSHHQAIDRLAEGLALTRVRGGVIGRALRDPERLRGDAEA